MRDEKANTLVLGECFANLPSAFCVHMVSRFIHCQKIGILPKRDGYLNFLLLATGELGKTPEHIIGDAEHPSEVRGRRGEVARKIEEHGRFDSGFLRAICGDETR